MKPTFLALFAIVSLLIAGLLARDGADGAGLFLFAGLFAGVVNALLASVAELKSNAGEAK